MKAVSKFFFVFLVGSIVLLLTVSSFDLAHAQQSTQQQSQPPKQQPQKPKEDPEEDAGQVLKVGTKLVNVLFSVTDKQNRYLDNLTKEDLTVFENGQQQEIFTFKKEFDLPLTMAIMVDVSGSEQYVLPQLKDAGGHFIDSVIKTGKDVAAIIKFEGEATLMQNLTSNKNRLRKGLEDVAYIPAPGQYGGTPGINGGSRQGGTSIYDSVIAACADLLAREAGRKTIVLLTDGVDTTSRMRLNDAITEALRSEVVIYAIGIGDAASSGTFMGNGVNEGELKKLTEATGGRAFIPNSRRDLESAFLQLEQDMRQQYLLAYEPSNETPDGSFRKIEIKVPKFKEKDLKIRHRRGYYAAKG
ncbi:MAG: VWA domain-containing protein [Acidobacteria bacterium]|nr:VWA domain-containing protein [Acidobacteriota bacterium]